MVPLPRPRLALTAFIVAVMAQLWAIYSPEGAGAGWLPQGSDKVAHALIFAAPVVLGALAGLRHWVVVGVLVVHAPVSELIQHFWLPGRSGDPWDVVADLTGVLLGWLIVRYLAHQRALPSDDPAPISAQDVPDALARR